MNHQHSSRSRFRATASAACAAVLVGAALTLPSGGAHAVDPTTDTTAPVVTLTRDTPANDWGWNNGPVSVTVSAYDQGGSGMSAVYLRDGADGPVTRWQTSPVTRTFEAEGVRQVEAWAADYANNVSQPSGVTLRIDRTAPTVTGSDPDMRHLIRGEFIGFSPLCSDALSGIAVCTVDGLILGRLDTSTVGLHTIRMTAVDLAGNTAERDYHYVVDAGRIAAPSPKIVGVPKVGKRLTVKVGTWKPSGVSLSYQWYRSGKPIPGATKTAYTLKKSDRRARITVKVTGKKRNYQTVVRRSAATARVR